MVEKLGETERPIYFRAKFQQAQALLKHGETDRSLRQIDECFSILEREDKTKSVQYSKTLQLKADAYRKSGNTRESLHIAQNRISLMRETGYEQVKILLCFSFCPQCFSLKGSERICRFFGISF